SAPPFPAGTRSRRARPPGGGQHCSRLRARARERADSPPRAARAPARPRPSRPRRPPTRRSGSASPRSDARPVEGGIDGDGGGEERADVAASFRGKAPADDDVQALLHGVLLSAAVAAGDRDVDHWAAPECVPTPPNRVSGVAFNGENPGGEDVVDGADVAGAV